MQLQNFFLLFLLILSLHSNLIFGQSSEWWYEEAEKQTQKANDWTALKAALNLYDQALQANPNNILALIGRGKLKNRLKKPQEAIEDLDRAINLNLQSAEAFFQRGLVYLSQQKYAQAITDFSNTLSIKPTYYATYEYLADAYAGQKNNALANSFYQKAFEQFPQKIELLDKYANFTQNQTKDYATTILLLNKIIEKIPQEPMYFIRRGTAYHASKQIERAIADYTEVIKLFPTDGTAYYYRGLAYSNLGNFEKACADMKKAATMGFEKAQTMVEKHCK